jgi:ribosome-associated protein
MDVSTGPAECHIRNGPARGILAREARPHNPRSRTIARKPTTDPASKPPAKRRPPKPVTELAEAAKSPGTPRKKAAAAGPKPRAPRKPKAEPSVLDRIQATIVESLESDKAEEIIVLDLAGRAAFTDRMVIATGLADRQISAMATHLQEKLRETGVGRVPVEGAGGSDWVLIDVGDIVVHLFKPEARALYRLEKMWGEDLDGEAEEPVA